MCQVTCNQGGINAPARPESKPFPAFLSLRAQMESRGKKEPGNEDTKPKPDASDGTMTIAYMVFQQK